MAASAVNPHCSATSFIHNYGGSSCKASCGKNLLPPGQQEQPGNNVLPISKRLTLTLINNATGQPVPEADVNVTTRSSFFHTWSSSQGTVQWEERWGRGNVSLEVFISAPDFITSQHLLELPCPENAVQPCLFNQTLLLDPLPPPEQISENTTCSSAHLALVVMDPARRKLPGTEVWLTLVSHLESGDIVNKTNTTISRENTTTSMETEVGHASTDDGGSFSWPISLNGRYQLRLRREGWEEETLEAEIKSCSSKSIEVTMKKKIQCEVDLNIRVVDEDDNAVHGAHIFFTVDPSSNNFNLTTPASGVVSTSLPPGPLQIQVLVSGSYPKVVDVVLECSPELANSSKVVVATMKPLPPTDAPSCYEKMEKPVLLNVSVTDLLTGDNVEGFVGMLTIGRNNEILSTSTNLAIMDGWSYPVETDGTYTLEGAAPGYLPASDSVEVSCAPSSCNSCAPYIQLKLRQEPSQKELILRVAVRDTSLLPLQDANVTIFLVAADGEQRPVSPLLQCGQDDGNQCGKPGATEEECMLEGCCWHSALTSATRELHPDVAPHRDVLTSTAVPTTSDLTTQKAVPITTAALTTTVVPTTSELTTQKAVSITTAAPATTVLTTTTAADSLGGSCFLPSGDSTLLTDALGLVASSLLGKGSYVVKARMEGFTTVEETIVVDSDEPQTIDLTMTPTLMCNNEGMEMEVNVINALTNEPLHNATVEIFLVHGDTQVDLNFKQHLQNYFTQVGGSLITGPDGEATTLVYTNATYRVVATAPGFIESSVEANPPDSCLTRSDFLVILPLSQVDDQIPDCLNCSVLLNLFDKITGAPVSALVDLLFEGKAHVATGVKTDSSGKARVAVNKMGKYQALLVPGSGYKAANASNRIESNNTELNISMYLTQPRCPNTTLTVNVKDNVAGSNIADARVSLMLTNSLAGESMLRQGPVHISNTLGLVTLTPPINGDYRVVVEAEDFISQELQVSVQCHIGQCYNCNQELEASLEQEFCEGKKLKMIVKDTTTNKALEGAQVTWSLETYQGPVDLGGTHAVDSNGTILLPISSNGKYSATVTKPGYLTATSFHEVSVSMDQCPHLALSQLVPLSPTLAPGCVRLSLIWGKEPADLDLYSFKVNSADTDERCLTYYCDGKDPCGCASFDVDNTRGGEEGAETITYCGCNEHEDFTHMVWVDDLSGKGASMLSSQARILVTDAGGMTQEVKLVPGEQEAARYWVAGCLTTNSSSFSFTPLNQMSAEEPSEGMPLQCHTKSQLQAKQPLTSASLNVSVANTLGQPLPNASVILSSGGSTRTEKVGAKGFVIIRGIRTGNYSLSVEHQGYVVEVVEGHLSPDENAQLHVSMMELGEKGNLRIKLDWEEREGGRNLDLNLLKTERAGTQEACLTYWHNMDGCTGITLDQNVGVMEEGSTSQLSPNAKAETIAVQDFTSMQDSVFMVYVDDNSASGADLLAVTPHLTINDGSKSLSVVMPTMPQDSSPGVR